MEHFNNPIFDEIDAAGTWFRAKKVHAIWAKVAETEQTVETLEGTETMQAGDFLCRGAADELWPQTAASLEQKYDKTDEVDADGWRKYSPKADDQGVLAAQVSHPFEVKSPWGMLTGKSGDYIVKNYDEKDVDSPEDVWIIDKDLFAATYERVE